MEGLTAREWYLFGLQIIAPLLFALTIWLGRTSFMRTRARYIYGLAMPLYVVAAAYEGSTETTSLPRCASADSSASPCSCSRSSSAGPVKRPDAPTVVSLDRSDKAAGTTSCGQRL